MSEDKSPRKVSAVASGLLDSELERQLMGKIESKTQSKAIASDAKKNDLPPAEPAKKKSIRTTIKKVRLTPSKVMSMMVGGDSVNKSKSAEDLANSAVEEVSGGGESATPEKVFPRKQQKKDVKEAIFGPGGGKKRIKKRGSSTEDEGKEKKEKLPKGRRRKAMLEKAKKEEKPKTPTPKEPSSPPKDPTPPAKEPTPPPPKEPTPAPLSPTPPPLKEATPEEKKEPTPVKEATAELENVETVKTPSPAKVPTPIPVEKKPERETKGPPSDTDEEIISESGYFANAKSQAEKSQTNFGSLCCPTADKYTCSFTGRIMWLMLLMYRGPIRYTGRQIMRTAPYPKIILGPTFDSNLLEYILLLMDAVDYLVMRMFPDLQFEKIDDLMKEIDPDVAEKGKK